MENTSNIDLVIKIKDLANHTEYYATEINNSKRKEIVIVYDRLHESSPLEHPDEYYCNSHSDLTDMISWMISHSELWLQ